MALENSEELLRELAASSERFKLVMDDHISTYSEIIPHVLFADISAEVEHSINLNDMDWIEEFLNDLNLALNRSDELFRGAVALSFLENLSGRGVLGRIRPLMKGEISRIAETIA